MIYQIRHLTAYTYPQPSVLSYNEAWLKPRTLAHQRIIDFDLIISPIPYSIETKKDFFYNEVSFFNIQQAHSDFKVEALSKLERSIPNYFENPNSALQLGPWLEELSKFSSHRVDVNQFKLRSPLIPKPSILKEYALKSFASNRSLLDSIHELNTRIFEDYEYKQGFSTIATPLTQIVKAKKGVCQDFAHVAIACLRSLGLPARYVSGYIETLPPKGAPSLIGSAASHAWFSSYIPGMGWVDFDPTNNQMVKDQHITIAWGRDYSDVPPLKGVVYNTGDHKLSVSVDVIYRRVDDEFIDPEVFRKDSLLGVKGLMRAYLAGNVSLANAPGTGFADDKAVYTFMPEIIDYYLGEKPILKNVKTYRCYKKDDLQYVLENVDKLVVKPVDEAGGYGISIGNTLSKEEIVEVQKRIKANPRKYIAQPIMSLSVHATYIEESKSFEPRHIDLRTYSLLGNDTCHVLKGGLSRVALKKGNLIVNSSQGGGSKDTWVLTK